jgi:plasmid stabilization system protein ParE
MPGAVVRFHRLALKDRQGAVSWYARLGANVVLRFIDALSEASRRIEANPFQGTPFRSQFRWVRVHGFPYLLYYHILDPSNVLVLAVAHTKRRLGYWIRRAKN